MQAIVDKIQKGERISEREALVLLHDAPLGLLSQLATARKKKCSGDKVYYNRNFHLEPTNLCFFNCKFCSFRQPKGSDKVWEHSMEEIEEIVRQKVGSGATEVHIVGGVHPEHDIYYYVEMIRRIKVIMPNIIIKAFTAVELSYMIRKANLSLEEGLLLLKEAGMEAIAGGGAEIFDPELRAEICPEKCSATEWLELHKTAHKIEIPTNATILYGHIETYEQRISHLAELRNLQDITNGFNAFIPLKYKCLNNDMGEIGEVSTPEDMRFLAVCRIFLDNFAHIKAYWVMYGKAVAEIALAFGADDIDGTIDDSTKIYSMAGAEEQRPTITIEEIKTITQRAGMRAVERDTFYNEIKK